MFYEWADNNINIYQMKKINKSILKKNKKNRNMHVQKLFSMSSSIIIENVAVHYLTKFWIKRR